jgi:membrane protease YdiL (CAAX protease family)
MSFAAIFYVLLIGVFLPVQCIWSYYKMKAGAPIPSKNVSRISALIMHALMFLLAFLTWRSFDLPMFPRQAIAWKEVGFGLAVLAVFLSFMIPLWKKKAMTNPQKVYLSVPQRSNELGLWAVVSLSAGFVEEIVYRGVLFGILDYWLKNWWAAAILCAIAFGIGHAIQGWKGAAIIFGMSVIFQGLVYFTGGLYIAMAVHAIYDFIAGVMYLYFWNHGAKDRMPPTPAPQEASAV